MFTDDELPMFPVESDFMAGVKYRVNLAREIDKEEHRWVVDKHLQVFFLRVPSDTTHISRALFSSHVHVLSPRSIRPFIPSGGRKWDSDVTTPLSVSLML